VEAAASHSGVDLEVEGQTAPDPAGDGRVALERLEVTDRRRDPRLRHIFQFLRRTEEMDDPAVDPFFPELDALRERRDPVAPRLAPFQDTADRAHPDAVSVRFDHRQHARARLGPLDERVVVCNECAKVHVDPGARRRHVS
jgi:hypothetical protein